MSAPPDITCTQIHPSVVVADIAAAVDFYTTKLGFFCAFTWGDPPTFAGVNLDCVQMFLTKSTPKPEDASIFFVISDADALYAFHRSTGVEVAEEIGNREWDFRDYTVRDLHGHYLTFGHRLER